ncbi:hypothetical protein Pmani_003701 [Petrolisthes manimaculis]|uniref:Tc1-like transposase DDE domain-containing protein n=1 Tax=Petrolisthes manimaculis TaxID=1843537 RepID=A0AAE1UI76_9EUCA|nr:hypothetical protein Pmani_003701 [Petrolisthes manimaculis]
MPRTVIDTIDNFDQQCIRKETLSFYERGELPKIDSLLKYVREPPVNYCGGRSTLWKIVRKLGFRRNLAEGSVGPKVKTGKGARFIILHEGGSNGFIPGALLMFRSKNGSKGYYHDAMNCDGFNTWFVDQLLPNIEENSLIVMDNASYHSRKVNKAPAYSSRKSVIIEWLSENNISYDATLNKPELMEICRQNIEKSRYEIDDIAALQGHEVLRLPPYHCELNPIELIWAKVKTKVKKLNSNAQ